MKNILIINVNWLGDVLFSTPFIRAVRNKYPDAHLACMIVPRCKEILEGNPYLDELIIYDEEGEYSSLLGKLQFISLLRSKKFDEVYLLHRSLTRTLITALAKIPKRCGYVTKKRKLFLTHKVEIPKGDLHRVEYFLNLAHALDMPIDKMGYDFFIPSEVETYIEKFLEDNGITKGTPFIVLNPGANWFLKRWPPKYFGILGDMLTKKMKAKVVISGADKDSELAQEIAEYMETKPVIATGKTTLKQLGGLFKRTELIVTNDTGPLHIAVAVGAKVLALFGPTASKITGPYGPGKYRVIQKDVGCTVPCYHLKCKDNRCMKSITPDEVFAEVKKLVSND
ncbi:MAG: lipopolysaccharide heptosyltransferase II [Candidatus Omnitrophica bacterium]|nr:lipopolysaccharide heptosyltransferase II [Candidatus Omnitrophota bacterium]